MQVPVYGHWEHPCASTLKILSWCFSLTCFLSDITISLYCSWHPGYIPQSYLGTLSSAKIVSVWQLVATLLWLQNSHFSCHTSHQMLHLPDCFCFRQLCLQLHEFGGVVDMHIYCSEKKVSTTFSCLFSLVCICLYLLLKWVFVFVSYSVLFNNWGIPCWNFFLLFFWLNYVFWKSLKIASYIILVKHCKLF